MIQITLIMLAAACWAVMSHLIFHNKNDGPVKRYGFFGVDSWKRKYRRAGLSSKYGYDLLTPPNNIYYDIFDVEYEEKFPWSATVFVFLTDGVHLFQWLMFKFIFLALTLVYNDTGLHFDWKMFLILWGGWSIVFNIVFRRLNR